MGKRVKTSEAPEAPEPKRPCRRPYEKMIEELWAAREREREREPKPAPFVFPEHTEVDDWGFPENGDDTET